MIIFLDICKFYIDIILQVRLLGRPDFCIVYMQNLTKITVIK